MILRNKGRHYEVQGGGSAWVYPELRRHPGFGQSLVEISLNVMRASVHLLFDVPLMLPRRSGQSRSKLRPTDWTPPRFAASESSVLILLCSDCAETPFFNAGQLQIDGGYAEYTVADARYCFSIPKEYSDLAAAPLMCPGLIGYRCLRKAGLVGGDQGAKRVGIYGFGAAGHIVAQVGVPVIHVRLKGTW